MQLIEERALEALQTLPPSIQRVQPNENDDDSNNENNTLTMQIKTPTLYHFNPQTHTQIQEDLPAAVDLKTFLINSSTTTTTTTTSNGNGNANPNSPSQPLAHTIGRALGEWLRSFHEWIEAPAQQALRTQMGQNTRMQELKCSVNYDGLVDAVERFPGVLGAVRGVFERVRDMAREEVGSASASGVGGIHGDFWTGK